MKKIWVTVICHGDDEVIRAFETYDEIYGIYDYTEKISISETTYNKIFKSSGGYIIKRYGNTLRAYSY